MSSFKSSIAIATLAMAGLAGMAQPAFAQVDLQVFMWDTPAALDSLQNNKMDDGTNRLDDTMGMSVNVLEVPAGRVTFNVLNVSGQMPHEMVVSMLDGPDAVLPYDADIDRVDESRIGALGEVEAIGPGIRDSMSLDMKPGNYVLYCNLPGHYSAGMWTRLKVV